MHVPFCAHRCAYCSFVTLAGREEESGYFAALEKEVRSARPALGPVDSVYFGGGTPSYVAPEGLARILDALKETLGVTADAEVTAEGNPDDLSDARLEALRDLGVNRLSMGVQSLDDAELPHLERRHDARIARDALRRARRLFDNVSGDLMIGIPGQSRASLLHSLEGLIEAGVSHVSVYLLELEKAPKLVALKRERPELFPDDEEAATRWEEVDAHAEAAGLPRYELSNWAKPGFESRHNLKYWTSTPVVGFGVAAHGFDGRVRRENTRSLSDYVARVLAGSDPVVSESALGAAEAARERVLLRLRLRGGVSEEEFDAVRAGLAPGDRDRLEDAEAAVLLERVRGRVGLTRRGVLLSNEVFGAFV